MKIHKKILIAVIVAMVIVSLVAFYAPIRNIRQASAPAEPESPENLSASLETPTSSVSGPILKSTSTPSFKEMPGFSDLNEESDLLKDLGNNTSTEELNKTFQEINQ